MLTAQHRRATAEPTDALIRAFFAANERQDDEAKAEALDRLRERRHQVARPAPIADDDEADGPRHIASSLEAAMTGILGRLQFAG